MVEGTRNELAYRFREIILGGQDGLVNVLGLVLAVAGATRDPAIIVISGLAGLVAESISMAAVAYTSTRASEDYYRSRLQREIEQVRHRPAEAEEDIRQIYVKKGFTGSELSLVVSRVMSNPDVWVETMMAEEVRLFPEDNPRAWNSAVMVGTASVFGSLVPLLPFFLVDVGPAMVASLVLSVATLFATGVIKARITVGSWLRSGLEIAAVGMGAAIAGYFIGVGLSRML